MNLEKIKTSTSETFVQHVGVSITITGWGNMEGANIMVNGKDLTNRMCGSMSWEEIDALIVALAASRV